MDTSPLLMGPMASTGTFAIPYADVLGVRVSAINMAQAIFLADRWIAARTPGYVCVTGVHGVMEAQSDMTFRKILNSAVMNTPDGMPMSWVGWVQGHREMRRVYGPDFMAALCEHAAKQGYRNYLYGGKPGVAERLRERLQSRFPALKIVGTYTPPFRDLTKEEEAALLSAVHALSPDILWVGLSTPKQENFMARYTHRLGIPLLVGVGAAFDIHTGQIRDAPGWVKAMGMQWFHRMIQEPRRLSGRYLKNNPDFLVRIALDSLSRCIRRGASRAIPEKDTDCGLEKDRELL